MILVSLAVAGKVLIFLTSLNPVPNAQVCVCVFDDTNYKITTRNYISETSLYSTFQMYPSGPWPMKILMFALLVTCEIATYSWPWEKTEDGFCCRTWIYILRFSFPRRRRLLHQEDGGSHRILSAGLDGWWDGWMEKASRPRRPLLYVIMVNPRLLCLSSS